MREFERGCNTGSGKKAQKGAPIKEVRLHCPACGSIVKRAAQNFCDQCGYDVQSLKPKSYGAKATGFRKTAQAPRDSCPTCSNRVKLAVISPEKTLHRQYFRTHKGRIISLPWNVSMYSGRFEGYGAVGILFLAFLPLFIFPRFRRKKLIKFMLYYSGIYFIFWAALVSIKRYLMPI